MQLPRRVQNSFTGLVSQDGPEQRSQQLQACLAGSMLLLLKRYLLASYSLSAERVRQYHPNDTDRRRCALAWGAVLRWSSTSCLAWPG